MLGTLPPNLTPYIHVGMTRGARQGGDRTSAPNNDATGPIAAPDRHDCAPERHLGLQQSSTRASSDEDGSSCSQATSLWLTRLLVATATIFPCLYCPGVGTVGRRGA